MARGFIISSCSTIGERGGGEKAKVFLCDTISLVGRRPLCADRFSGAVQSLRSTRNLTDAVLLLRCFPINARCFP